MALFIIERQFAEQLQDSDPAANAQVQSVNEELGLHWLYSFLTADRKKTYCLYEAADPEVLREHARCLGLPADVIVEVTQLTPDVVKA